MSNSPVDLIAHLKFQLERLGLEIAHLDDFLKTEDFIKLNFTNQYLLKEQRVVMEKHYCILRLRFETSLQNYGFQEDSAEFDLVKIYKEIKKDKHIFSATLKASNNAMV